MYWNILNKASSIRISQEEDFKRQVKMAMGDLAMLFIFRATPRGHIFAHLASKTLFASWCFCSLWDSRGQCAAPLCILDLHISLCFPTHQAMEQYSVVQLNVSSFIFFQLPCLCHKLSFVLFCFFSWKQAKQMCISYFLSCCKLSSGNGGQNLLPA